MSTFIPSSWIRSSHLAAPPDLSCHVSMHEQSASLTLWYAAVSPSPSTRERLRDFLPRSITLKCGLIHCDNQLALSLSLATSLGCSKFSLTCTLPGSNHLGCERRGLSVANTAPRTANQRDVDWSQRFAERPSPPNHPGHLAVTATVSVRGGSCQTVGSGLRAPFFHQRTKS